MCLAVPSRVVAIEGDFATVEAFGHRRRVRLMLMREPVALGDYLVIQGGGFAVERLDQALAKESLGLWQALAADGRLGDLGAAGGLAVSDESGGGAKPS